MKSKPKSKRIIVRILFSIVFVLIFTSANALEINEKVDVAIGTRLMKLAIAGTAYEHLGFGSPPENSEEVFLIYQLLGQYEGTIAWLAVNPWTGDVWDMDKCKILSNPVLRKAQSAIKKQFDNEELKEYSRLHRLMPYQMYNLEPCISVKK